MKIIHLFCLFVAIITFNSCIKDDIIDDRVDPVLRITSNIDTLKIDSSYQFENMYLNNIGNSEDIEVVWTSEDPSIIGITPNGLAIAKELGTTKIIVSLIDQSLKDTLTLSTGENTTAATQSLMSNIQTTSSYELTGSFEYLATSSGVKIIFEEDYKASTALPGLFVYLSNNPSTVANAYEIGSVQVFEGAHEYVIPDIEFEDYQYLLYFCKPFNVKVGDGSLSN